MVNLLDDGQFRCQVLKTDQYFSKCRFAHFETFSGETRDKRSPDQGCNHMNIPQMDRYLSLIALRSHVATARSIEMDFWRDSGVKLSDQKTRNRQHEDNFPAGRSDWPIILTQLHHRARLVFTWNHVMWHVRHWCIVMLMAKSRFHISTCDIPVQVWRHQGKRYHDDNIIQNDRYICSTVHTALARSLL